MESGKEHGLQIVNQELLQLNQYLNSNLVLNKNHFIITDNFKANDWGASVGLIDNKTDYIDSYEYKEAKNNVFARLSNITSLAKEQILRNERTFLKAYANQEIDSFWKYIENLFKASNKKENEYIKKCVQIILNELDDLSKHFLVNIALIMDPFFVKGEWIGLNKDDLLLIYDEVLRKQNFMFNLSFYKTKIKKPFLKFLINYHRTFTSNAQKEKWRSFLKSTFIELYEYRNSEVHSGRTNEFSRLKLSFVMPLLINRIRLAFVEACEQNENLSFDELVDIISK